MVWYIALVEEGNEVHAPSAQAQGGAPAQCVGKEGNHMLDVGSHDEVYR